MQLYAPIGALAFYNFADKLQKWLDMDNEFKKLDLTTLVGTIAKEENSPHTRLFVNGSLKTN